MVAYFRKLSDYAFTALRHPVLLVVAGLGVLAMVTPLPAYAGVQKFFASIILWIAQFMGKITITLIGILVEVVQYNDFINAPAVVKGWVVVRDVVNMFFIVVLLVISFGTMFRMEEYQYKHHLGKLLTMAVLVNFSKSIAGFFIDFAQVVMLTFVNGFKEAAAGNFINGFHLDKMFQFADKANPAQASDESAFLYAALLALITIAITAVVVGVYLIIFLIRIVALWFLIIISPIAYLLAAWPGKGREYHEQWWEYFGKYASTGPILAFFLWLSLAVMQFSDSALGDFKPKGDMEFAIPNVTITGIGSSEVLLSFIVSVILLIGGLWMASKLGVAGGSLASGAMHGLQKAGAAPFKGAAWAGKKAGVWGLRRLDDAQAAMQKKFMRSAPGQWLAKTKIGEGLGLGKIAEHGIQLRSIPHAWEERSKRKERERLGASAGVAEDIMSRTLSIGRDRPNKTAEISAKLSEEAAKEVTSVATDWEHLASEADEAIEYEGEGENLKIVGVKSGKEHLLEAILVQLSKTHDTNEILKHTKMGRQFGLQYTSQGVVKFLMDAFGKGKMNESVARVGFRMQETGLYNTDGLIKGSFRMRHGHYEWIDGFDDRVKAVQSSDHTLTREDARQRVLDSKRNSIRDQKRDELALEQHGRTYEQLTAAEQQPIAVHVDAEVNGISNEELIAEIRKEVQGEIAAAFIAKRTFRSIANQARFQDFLAEIADTQGNRYGGKLTNVGIANISMNGAAMAQHYNAMNEETKRYLSLGVDQFLKYFEANVDRMDEEKKDNWRRFISAVTTGKQVTDERDIVDYETLQAHVESSVNTRNKTVLDVNKDRRENNIRDVEGVTLQDDEPVYNVHRTDLWNTPPPATDGGGGRGQQPPGGQGGGGRVYPRGTVLDQYGNPVRPQPKGRRGTRNSGGRRGTGTPPPADSGGTAPRGPSTAPTGAAPQAREREAAPKDSIERALEHLSRILDQFSMPLKPSQVSQEKETEQITPRFLAPPEFTQRYPSVNDLVGEKISLEGFQFSEQDRREFLGHILGAIKKVQKDIQNTKESNLNPDVSVSTTVSGVLGSGSDTKMLQAMLVKDGNKKTLEEVMRMDISEVLQQLMRKQSSGNRS